jgi:hypothetical protein
VTASPLPSKYSFRRANLAASPILLARPVARVPSCRPWVLHAGSFAEREVTEYLAEVAPVTPA